jgi:hypothetical protein
MSTIKGMTGGLFAAKGPQALAPKESVVSKAIQEFLDARKIYNDRLNSGKINSVTKYLEKRTGTWKEFSRWIFLCKKGTPDRFFIVCGRVYFVEVKKLGGVLSEEQTARHKELRRSGAVVMVADSIDSFIDQFNNLFAPN